MLKLKGNKIYLSILCFCILLLMLYPTAVYANSSWHWVTISPMKVLPFAIILTLVIETLGVVVYGKVKEKARAFFVVSLANIVSFTVPYIYAACRLNKFYMSGWSYAWNRAFNSGPHYMIKTAFLVLTLCIELPLVYFFLRKHTAKRKQLLLAIIVTNTITTLIMAILERLLCHGRW